MVNRVVCANANEAEINCGGAIICFGLDMHGRPKELSRVVIDLDGRVPGWQYKAACAQATAAIKDHRKRAAYRPAQLNLL